MITYPSYDKLMEKVDSPYTLIIMAARRARQINVGGNKLLGEDYKSHKSVSMSLEEVVSGKITYRKNRENSIK
ncbi:MAG: DNA-directed RNA polymerase subunit omega [Halanaerobiaceae bacterium]